MKCFFFLCNRILYVGRQTFLKHILLPKIYYISLVATKNPSPLYPIKNKYIHQNTTVFFSTHISKLRLIFVKKSCVQIIKAFLATHPIWQPFKTHPFLTNSNILYMWYVYPHSFYFFFFFSSNKKSYSSTATPFLRCWKSTLKTLRVRAVRVNLFFFFFPLPFSSFLSTIKINPLWTKPVYFHNPPFFFLFSPSFPPPSHVFHIPLKKTCTDGSKNIFPVAMRYYCVCMSVGFFCVLQHCMCVPSFCMLTLCTGL